MKKIIFLVLISSFGFSSHSQNLFCGKNAVEQKWRDDKNSIESKKALEKFTAAFVKKYVVQNVQDIQSDTILYVIPLVFHIMHNYGDEYISKAQILSAVNAMNEYYQKLNADTSQVVQQFKSIIGDAKIEFRLARIDPNGNCTDGITRTQTYLTYGGDELLKSLILWPTNKYVNIWVEEHIGWGPFAAYATLPFFPRYVDGIVFDDSYLGDTGTSFPGNEFILAHEMGHILNLEHTWGPTNTPGDTANCNFDDDVTDTPNCIGATTCDTNMNSCTQGVIANVQNMMEYSYCNIMFTQGQVMRMHACLNDTVGGRNNLWSATNLIATGTNNGYISPLCAPIADLSDKKIRICQGDSVTFYNLSFGADTIFYNWQFTGGNISSSTLVNPTVVYNTVGFYDVTLTAYNNTGTSTITHNAIIEVSAPIANTTVPAVQGFETINFPSGYWDTENQTGTTWQLTNNASATGAKSVYIQTDSTNTNTTDVFYTESYNFLNITAPALNFKLAFAQKNNSNDNLKVFMSTNCSQTWNLRYSKSGSSLQTVIDSSGNFVPLANQWRLENIQINAAAAKDNVRFKFVFTSQGGNNIFIDDININGTTGLHNNNLEVGTMEIFPNPSASDMVSIYAPSFYNSMLNIYSIDGEKINSTAFNQQLSINLSHLPKGMYIAEITDKEGHTVRSKFLNSDF